MPSLLVTTPHYVLRYDLSNSRTYILEQGRSLYYGASWFKGDDQLCLGHSGNGEISDLINAAEYQRSEVGYVSCGKAQSWPFLSNPHQIRCLDYPYIATTNTGRNAIAIVDCEAWTMRQLRFDKAHWDRFDPTGESGNHYNSIDFDGETLYVLAHNFNNGSYELAVEWPSLKVLRRTDHTASQLHNLWVRKDGRRISCDSRNGALIDLSTDQTLWSSGESECYTRGLACIGDEIFVGASEIRQRADRDFGRPGIWVVDRNTFETKRFIDLNWFGVVLEIRALDVFDECHPVGPIKMDDYMTGAPADAYVDTPGYAETYARLKEIALRRRATVAKHLEQAELEKAIVYLEESRLQQKRLAAESQAVMVERDQAIHECRAAQARASELTSEISKLTSEIEALQRARRSSLTNLTRIANFGRLVTSRFINRIR